MEEHRRPVRLEGNHVVRVVLSPLSFLFLFGCMRYSGTGGDGKCETAYVRV